MVTCAVLIALANGRPIQRARGGGRSRERPPRQRGSRSITNETQRRAHKVYFQQMRSQMPENEVVQQRFQNAASHRRSFDKRLLSKIKENRVTVQHIPSVVNKQDFDLEKVFEDHMASLQWSTCYGCNERVTVLSAV